MNYKIEFPHYDDELTLPDGWLDTSWHNDVCPSFENKIDGVVYRIWCDFKDPSLSEVGGLRFAVNRRTIEQDDELIPLGEFNTLQEALDWTHTNPSI
jgi:hypothetical protein